MSGRPQALVLVPGLMCDATVWRHVQRHCHDRMPTQVVDHGDCASLRDMAHQLLATAPDYFAIAGHSMGGRVALEVMRLVLSTAPERVTHLALLDTGCRALPEGAAGEAERDMRLGFLRLAQQRGVAAMARTWVRNMVHPDRWNHDPALIEEIVTMFARKPVSIYAAQIHALLNRDDAWSLLPQIHCPTLVLTGVADVNSPPAANEAMAAAMPGAELVVLAECGHMSMQEQPTAVQAALDAWLDR